MKSTLLNTAALMAALAALAISLAAFFRTDVTPVRADLRQADSLRVQCREIEIRLADLEQRAGATAPGAIANDSSGSLANESSEKRELAGELRRLASSVAALEAAARPLFEKVSGAEPGAWTPEEKDARESARRTAVKGYREVVLDLGSSVERRIASLELLRYASRDSEERDRAVIESAVGMLDSDVGSDSHARVIRALKGVKSDVVAARLVRVLLGATDATVREEAAETLGELLEYASVRETLEQAAKGDSDRRVRSQALDSLRQGD